MLSLAKSHYNISIYPERKEEAIKDRLYEAYKRSNKTVDFIIDFIENALDEDDFCN